MIGDSAMCFGKKIYTTYWQAARGAKNLNKHVDSARGNVYRCPYCHDWHVGNTLNRTGRKKYNRRDLMEDGDYGRI